MSNDWIKWNGGDNPLGETPDAIVDVIVRSGKAATFHAARINWSHRNAGSDIVSYRISDTQPQSQPAKPCSCFPGQCRGQVLDGKQPNGDRCKKDYAKSDEAWFEWHPELSLPTHPGMAGRYSMEWTHVGIVGISYGFSCDPVWTLPGSNPARVQRYRWTDPRVMLLNPYTGQRRHVVDIMQDPEGKLVQMASDAGLIEGMLRAVGTASEAAFKQLGDALRSLDDSIKAELITDPAKIEATFAADDEAAGNVRFALPETDRALLPDDTVTLTLPRDVLNCLDATAKATGQSLDDVIGEALRRDIEGSFKPALTDVLYSEEKAVAKLESLGYTYIMGDWRTLEKAPAMTAPDLLDAAAGHMRDRAKTYDKPEGERSMGATVEAFNAITGRDLRESEGWLLMTLLKLVRSETRDAPHRDSVEDLIAYSGLYGEARLGGV